MCDNSTKILNKYIMQKVFLDNDVESSVKRFDKIDQSKWEVVYNDKAIGGKMGVSLGYNDELIYGFMVPDTPYHLDMCKPYIEFLKLRISGHPFNFFDPDTENERKILYRGLPAKIYPYQPAPWMIDVFPDIDDNDYVEWWDCFYGKISIVNDGVTSFNPRYKTDLETVHPWMQGNPDRSYGHITYSDIIHDDLITWL